MQVNSGSYLLTGSLRLPFITAWSFNETASWQSLSQSFVSQAGVNQLLINGNTEFSSTYNINATNIVSDNSIGTQWVFIDTTYRQYEGNLLIPVNTFNTYSFSMWARSSGSVQAAAYFGFSCYDERQRFIDTSMAGGYGDTYLTADLVAGSRTASLLSTASWALQSDPSYMKMINYYPANSAEFYTPWKYTRSQSAWTSRSLNEVYLDVAYVGSTIPSGSPVSNGRYGSTYNYNLFLYGPLPDAWTYYSSSAYDEGNTSIHLYNRFRYGTKYIKWMCLANYGGVGDGLRYGRIVIGNLSNPNDGNPYNKQMSITPQNIVISSGLNEIS